MNLFTEIQLQIANAILDSLNEDFYVNTGEIYNSIAYAERKNGFKKGQLAYSLRVGKLLNNLKFDYVKN